MNYSFVGIDEANGLDDVKANDLKNDERFIIMDDYFIFLVDRHIDSVKKEYPDFDEENELRTLPEWIEYVFSDCYMDYVEDEIPFSDKIEREELLFHMQLTIDDLNKKELESMNLKGYFQNEAKKMILAKLKAHVQKLESELFQ